MAKTGSLHLLVNSLTKGEKRYFKIYTALQQGDKDYLVLFGLFEKINDYKEVKKEFSKKRPGSSFEATGKYLYKVLTDCLLHIRLEQGRSNKLVVAMLKANILFEKSMYADGFRELKKLQTVAEQYEHHVMLLWAIRTELNFRNNLNYYDMAEKDLVRKQLKIDELLKYIRNIHQHTSLYELLRYRLLYKGAARTKSQKEALNDLVVSELNLTSNPFSDTFESHKTHLLFQANYFISVNDFNSALKTFYELNTLLEKREYLWVDSQMDYISTTEGILDTLHTIGRFNEMQFFIERLHKLPDTPAYLDVIIQKIVFIYKAVSLLNNGKFEEAVKLKEEFDDMLFKRIHLLDLNKQAEVYLHTAIIYLSTGKISKAHFFLNKILLESRLYHSLPVFRTFRILHLLVHYELGNHEYISSETRSIKRALSASRTGSYMVEKLIFRFVMHPDLPKSEKHRASYWKKIRDEFSAISSDKYEMQVLKIFDFRSWVYSRIYKLDFAEVFKSKVAV